MTKKSYYIRLEIKDRIIRLHGDFSRLEDAQSEIKSLRKAPAYNAGLLEIVEQEGKQ